MDIAGFNYFYIKCWYIKYFLYICGNKKQIIMKLGIKELKEQALQGALNGWSRNKVVMFVYEYCRTDFQGEYVLTKVFNALNKQGSWDY